MRRAERDQEVQPGATSEERVRIRALERKVCKLRRASEIRRKASVYFAQVELGGPSKLKQIIVPA